MSKYTMLVSVVIAAYGYCVWPLSLRAQAVQEHSARILSPITSSTQEMLAQAKSVPPEFHADALLQLAKANRDRTPEAEKWFIEAYDVASQSQHMFPQIPAAEHRFGMVGDRFYVSRLDRLSLQAAAVEELERKYPLVAKELFERMPTPKPAKIDCNAEFVDDPTPYYRAAAIVLPDLGNPGLKGAFLTTIIGRANNEAEVAPVVDFLVGARGLSHKGYESAVEQLILLLNRARGDSASYSATVGHLDASISLLFSRLSQWKLEAPVRAAYEGYLLQHETSGHCTSSRKGNSIKTELAILEARGIESGSQPSESQDELAPSTARIDDATAATSSGYEALYEEAYLVRSTVLEPAELDSLSQSEKVRTQLELFLNKVEQFDQSRDDEHFNIYKARCTSLVSVLEFAPESDQRVRGERMLASLLVESGLFEVDRVDWFYDVQAVMTHVGTHPQNQRLVRLLEETNQPVLVLYSNLVRNGVFE